MQKALKFAFFRTIPIFCGYLFLGMAFGLLLQQAGFGPIWAFISSLFIYAGSMQFVLVSFIGGGLGVISIIIITLSINCRHIFYGISFIEKFKSMGKKYLYMIFSLTDETYSLLCSSETLPGVDEDKYLFSIALLDHCYWIFGSVLGAVLGEIIPFDTTGVDFAMTALFAVIFTEQWLSFKTHIPAITGIICGTVCLIIFGADKFILPAMISSVCVLMIMKNIIKERGEFENDK